MFVLFRFAKYPCCDDRRNKVPTFNFNLSHFSVFLVADFGYFRRQLFRCRFAMAVSNWFPPDRVELAEHPSEGDHSVRERSCEKSA